MSTTHTSAYDNNVTYPLHHARIGYQSYVQERSNSDVSVSSAETNFPKDAPLRPDTFEAWKPTSAGTWRIDLGSAQTVDYVAIVGSLKGVQVTIEYSSDDTSWTTFAAAQTPTGGEPLLFLDASIDRRYWRISLDSVGSVASVYIGEILEMERSFFGGHGPINLSRQTQRRNNMSRGGQFIAQDIVRTGFTGSMQWRNLDPTWYRNNFDPFVLHMRTQPAFIAWNIRDYPDEVIYAWTGEDARPVNVAQTPGGLMEVSMNLTGVGWDE